MEIINCGRILPRFRGTCNYCFTSVEVEASELTHRVYVSDGIRDGRVRCPACDAVMLVFNTNMYANSLTSPAISQEKIRSAAVKKDGVVYPCWAHTYDEIKRMNLDAPDDVLKNPGPERSSIQGFVTTFGRFVDREEAFKIAEAANQIKHKHGPKASEELYSEDLRD